MVYLEPTTLGWRPIVKSWIESFSEVMQRESGEVINDMFEWLIDPCLDFVRKNTKVGHSDTYSKNFSEFWLHSIQVLYIRNIIVSFYFSTIYYLFAGIHQFQTSQSGALSHVHDWHVDDRDPIQGRRQWEQTYQELLHGKFTAILFFFIRKRVPVILWHMETPQINSIQDFQGEWNASFKWQYSCIL